MAGRGGMGGYSATVGAAPTANWRRRGCRWAAGAGMDAARTRRKDEGRLTRVLARNHQKRWCGLFFFDPPFSDNMLGVSGGFTLVRTLFM